MTKKERENIDFIVDDLKESVNHIERYNCSISKLSRLYEKSKKLNKEESETFEKVCKQIEEVQNDLDKTISWLSCYGVKD